MTSFTPTASLELLRRRADLFRRVREHFDLQGFIEVQTPVLSHDTVLDRCLEPLSLVTSVGGYRERFFLQTSPEFAMKRLLASGMQQIYQIGPVFRAGDRGPTHNVEFTMLEWYSVNDSYQEGMDRLAALIRALGGGEKVDRLSFGDLFEERTRLNPHCSTSEEYREYAKRNGLIFPDTYTNSKNPVPTDDWMDLIFSQQIESTLGQERPLILFDYPESQSQLAQTRSVRDEKGSYRVTERFELFIKGREIANGYHELLDPAELRRRNEETNRARLREGRDPLPVESRLLQAMDFGLPPCSGTALGLERLMMALWDLPRIEMVLSFPIERA